MAHREVVAVVAFAVGLAREPGCGSVEDPQGGTNAPCTRASDCSGNLFCAEGVCVAPDAGDSGPAATTDASARDADDDG